MILDRIFEGLSQRNRADYIANWLTGGDEFFTSLTGESVTQDSALKLSAVFRCVNILSDDVSKLPIHQIKVSGEERKFDYEHPASQLVSMSPNEVMVPIVFWKLMEMRRELWGNAYAYIETDYNGYPSALIPLPPEYVLPFIDATGNLWYIAALPGLDKRKLPASEVIHLKGISKDGVTGISILQYARETIGAGQAEQKFEGYLYLRGMKLGGVVEVPSKVSPADREIVRAEFEKMTSGLNNMHRVAVLDLNQKFIPLNMPLKDAQFIETKQSNIRDIARFWGIPLYKLFEGKEAYSSNEQQDLDYMKNSLDPVLVQYEQELRLKLLTKPERKKRYFRFNRSAQLRADLKTRSEYLKLMVDMGIYTRNEARAYEELNPYKPGGDNPADKLTVSLNYTTIDQLEKIKAAGQGTDTNSNSSPTEDDSFVEDNLPAGKGSPEEEDDPEDEEI